MSPEAPEPTGPRVSREEERERLLAETLAHASAQDEAFRKLGEAPPPRGWWKAGLSLVFLLLAAYLGASPPSWLVPGTRPTLDRYDLEQGTRAALYLEAQQIEAFRLDRGRFPYSLSELSTQVPGVLFVRSNNRVYQLVARGPDGSSVVYDSAHPATDFEAAAAGWAGWQRPQ